MRRERPPFGKPGSERGVALVASLLIMTLISALAIALTASGRIEVAMGDNEEVYARTRAAADAGLNHAAVVVRQALTGTVAVTDLLRGPDGAMNALLESATANADNGRIDHLMGSAGPWLVAPGSEYSYNVRLFDDDDPALKNGAAFSAAELLAMAGGIVSQQENANRYLDMNQRLVIRATGFGPQGTVVQLEQMLTPITGSNAALLVNGDLRLAGNAEISGSQGSVHSNGNLIVEGNSVEVEFDATSTGTLTAGAGWHPGGLMAGGMPRMPVPDVSAAARKHEADFVLQSDGRITNRLETILYCSGAACRNYEPDGLKPFGWTFSSSTGWSLSDSGTFGGTFYAETDVTITGNPSGGRNTPLRLSIIAEGNIDIAGTPDIVPAASSMLQFLTDKDLQIRGNLDTEYLRLEGDILVREQISLAGNPSLAGRIKVQNVPSVSSLVTDNVVTGSVTLTYNGSLSTVTDFTVQGYRETR